VVENSEKKVGKDQTGSISAFYRGPAEFIKNPITF